jgi:hypothetical protein
MVRLVLLLRFGLACCDCCAAGLEPAALGGMGGRGGRLYSVIIFTFVLIIIMLILILIIIIIMFAAAVSAG